MRLSLLALFLAACSSAKSEPIDAGPPDGPPVGALKVSWRFTVDGSAASCTQANIMTVRVTLTDAVGAATPTDTDCSALRFENDALMPGDYLVTLTFVDPTGATVATLLGGTGTATVSVGQTADLGAVELPLGTFTCAWSITRAGIPATCDEAGAAKFELAIHPTDNRPVTAAMFPCADMTGKTAPLPVGDYTLSPLLIGGDSSIVALHEGTPGTINGTAPLDLGTFVFDLP